MGKIIGGIGKFLLGGGLLGMGIKALVKQPKQLAPPAIPTRDDAAAAAAADDELQRRRGAQADIITGTRGAEALPTAGRLVRGN
jgi:hypothetical protein